MQLTLQQLADKWKDAPPGELAQLQTYITELCHALGVDPPGLKGSGYEFNLAITVTEKGGTDASNFLDCWKAGHFVLEGKHVQAKGSDDIRLRRAFGQVKGYANNLPERPPYIMVLDIGRTLLLWDRWSGDYGGFGVYRRIDLTRLGQNADDVALLKAIWTDPASLDPRARAAAVTRDIAGRLAALAASLESRGLGQEDVARFLIRVVFTMFAEDVNLLPEDTFRDLISDNPPADLPEALEDLWETMDKGGRFGGKKIVRFNGHFFREAKALPLKKADCDVLTMAALADWQDVEPSIFGTLLVRALDPVERHRLGAEFTPREYVERLVRPTVEEPIQERWTAVQAEALQLRETGKEKDRKAALQSVVAFHEWLCGLQFLDPACGSGNFLYVTLNMVKRVELEVVQLENDLRKAGDADLRFIGCASLAPFSLPRRWHMRSTPKISPSDLPTLLALLATLSPGLLVGQRSPIERGSVQIAGTGQIIHTRDIGNDRGWTVFELTPRIGYFVANGLAVNANLRFQRIAGSGISRTEWGLGPGLTYYLDIHSRHFYPFLSGRTLFTWDHTGAGPAGSTATKGTNRVWLASGGALVMLGEHVGISGELFYQHERFTSKSGPAPRVTNSSETYGFQWGVAAFLF